MGSTFDVATGTWIGSVVTDANNGGFIGVRSTPPSSICYDLSKCTGLEWILRNNESRGVRLKFVLRDSTEFNGVGWTSIEEIPGRRPNRKGGKVSNAMIKIPFRAMRPTRFAKTLQGDGKDNLVFDASNVRSFQLTYSKFEYDGRLNPKFYVVDDDDGDDQENNAFRVQLLEIRTY